ncbi:hypothetical protein EG329_008886 [Mollisiaceae sp. DMI_Dod_QoI]|nr:hypothetical protein EG329_008886 [Helotiales sp. DMI_Dod_QoI]
MSRIMKFPDDRLPGVAGLAKEFAARTGLTYMCGLWKENVVRGLGWNAYGTKSKMNLSTAPPSWSWACLSELPSAMILKNSRLYYQGQCTPVDEPKLVEISVVNENDDVFGQVKSARLTLTGKGQFVAHTSSPPAFSPSRLGMDVSTIYNSSISMEFQPDLVLCYLDEPPGLDGYTQKNLQAGTIYFRLGRWASDHSRLNGLHPNGILHALILEPVDGENVYKRIGIAGVPDGAVNETEWETSTVVIV